jgi:HK97 family phage major capsid protein
VVLSGLHSIAYLRVPLPVKLPPRAAAVLHHFTPKEHHMNNQIEQLVEKRALIMKQAQALMIDDQTPTAETRAKFDSMLADADVIEGDINRHKAVEKFEVEYRAKTTPPRPAPGVDAVESDVEVRNKKQKAAFEKYFRTGNIDMETRDITAASTGGYLVPQAFLPILWDAMKFYGPIQSLVTTKVTDNNGAPIKYATENDTANSISVLGEATAISEVDPTFATGLLSTDTLVSGLVKISWQELADSYFDLESYLKTKFGQRFGRGLEGYITNGNSSNITGLTQTFTSGVNSVSATAIGYADIAGVFAALDPAFIPNSYWIMNSKTRGALIATVDSYGRPLFDMSTSSNAFDTLIGRPVVLNQSLPNIPTTAGNKTPVMFGDFSQGYLLRTDGAPSVVVLKERYADTLENGYFAHLRAGGTTMNAGVSPVQSIVCAG